MEGEKGGKFEGKSSGGKALLLNESTIPGGGHGPFRTWRGKKQVAERFGSRLARIDKN